MSIHIANLFFEEELLGECLSNLEENFFLHPNFTQLQYLPLCYGKKEDTVLVTDLLEQTECSPELPTLSSFTIKGFFQGKRLEPWGHSTLLASFAKTHGLYYEMPPREVVKKIHSKQFVFEEGYCPSGSALLYNMQDALSWIEKTAGPKVLKALIGLSGRGHFLIESEFSSFKLEKFLEKEFKRGSPVLGEPWLNRLFDFSTQWTITKEGYAYEGATLLYNTPQGTYTGTLIAEEKELFKERIHYLEEHKEHVQALLPKISSLKFVGNIGVDAFVSDKGLLRPIVEINARKTMGYVALRMQQTRAPHQKLLLHYRPQPQGLLPLSVKNRQSCFVKCKRNLSFELLP